MINLNFQLTHTYNYPLSQPLNQPSMTALTVCKLGGDPALAFLTQTGQDDEVVYLNLGCDEEIHRHITPVNREVIVGMAYNPLTEDIWCAMGTSQMHEVMAFRPATGLETSSLNLAATDTITGLIGGIGTNGSFFVRSGGGKIELRTMNGFLLGVRDFPDTVTGLSYSPSSWTCIRKSDHKIMILNPFGDIVAEVDGPGPTAPSSASSGFQGLQAVAFDYVSNFDNQPQEFLNCGIGDVGTIYHPDTPWDPVPWQFRHRIYVANNTDQTIYAGYLYE